MSPVSCIYRIFNKNTGNFYIGCTVNFDKRKKEHFAALKNNRHHSIYLQRSYNKHGKESFSMEILETCSHDELGSREKILIETLMPKYNHALSNSYIPNRSVFNEDALSRMSEIKKVGWKNKTEEERENIKEFLKSINPSVQGKQRSKDYKLKISENMKRPAYRNKLWETKQKLISEGKFYYKKIPVVQYDCHNIFIKNWDSMKEASIECGNGNIKAALSSITNCCRGRNKTSYGFIWKYKNIEQCQ